MKMKHKYLISKDTPRQVCEPEDRYSGWYSNSNYTITGEVIITREQQAELLKQLVGI